MSWPLPYRRAPSAHRNGCRRASPGIGKAASSTPSSVGRAAPAAAALGPLSTWASGAASEGDLPRHADQLDEARVASLPLRASELEAARAGERPEDDISRYARLLREDTARKLEGAFPTK